MSQLTPVHWKVLECIFVKDGFKFARQQGSHKAYIKKGISRLVIIPARKSIHQDIILSNMRTAKMTRERYFELLAKCR